MIKASAGCHVFCKTNFERRDLGISETALRVHNMPCFPISDKSAKVNSLALTATRWKC